MARINRWSSLLAPIVIAAMIVIASPGPAVATVPGENGKIAFVSTHDGNPDIFVMDPDGANAINLTKNPAFDFSPDWSPDGRRIAFTSNRGGSMGIYLMNADGTDQTFLVVGEDPAWSPDGGSIAFAREDSIYVLRLGGSETRITDPDKATGLPEWARRPVRDFSPTWSPDQTRIAFVRQYAGPTPMASGAQLHMTPSGQLATPTLLASLGTGARDPDWSPDGTRILISDMPFHGIWSRAVVIPVDGSESTGLPVPSGYDNVVDPVWSPDGTSIAAEVYKINGGPPDVFVMNADGSNPVNLTSSLIDAGRPSWQPLNPYPVGMFDPGTGRWHLRDSSGNVTTFYFGSPGDTPFMGDWNCDGVDTPGLYRRSDGSVYLRNSNSQGVADVRYIFGNPGDAPIVGDFNGDGCDTVSVYRPSEGRFYIINTLGPNNGVLGAAEYSFYYGLPGDKPFIGDFDGDGIDTPGLHRETTGLVYIRNSNSQGFADTSFYFGIPGDRLVAYDWNGDGNDSPAVFRPAKRTFYFRFTNTQGVADASFMWGESHWLPVAGTFGSP